MGNERFLFPYKGIIARPPGSLAPIARAAPPHPAPTKPAPIPEAGTTPNQPPNRGRALAEKKRRAHTYQPTHCPRPPTPPKFGHTNTWARKHKRSRDLSDQEPPYKEMKRIWYSRFCSTTHSLAHSASHPLPSTQQGAHHDQEPGRPTNPLIEGGHT